MREIVKIGGGDALAEYQPNLMAHSKFLREIRPEGYLNPKFRGTIYDVSDYIDKKGYLIDHLSDKFFRCAVTSWDNTARKGKSGAAIYEKMTPEYMTKWLKDIMVESQKIHKEEENFVFISSWNEWAEGSHLEPDMEYGYSWLAAVKNAIEAARERK